MPFSTTALCENAVAAPLAGTCQNILQARLVFGAIELVLQLYSATAQGRANGRHIFALFQGIRFPHKCSTIFRNARSSFALFFTLLGTVHYNCSKMCKFSHISKGLSATLYNCSTRKCCCRPLAARRQNMSRRLFAFGSRLKTS